MAPISILGISGSLRQGSYNTMALKAAQALAPDGITVTIFDRLREIPLYDDDVRAKDGFPEPVEALRTAIRAADALLLVSPEYNYSIPGVLKNAIDWASRPGYRSVFRDKPATMVSAATSVVGGARVQGQLKQVLLGMAAEVFPWPEVLVGGAHQKIVDGRLVDEATRTHLRELLVAFAAWVQRRRA